MDKPDWMIELEIFIEKNHRLGLHYDYPHLTLQEKRGLYERYVLSNEWEAGE